MHCSANIGQHGDAALFFGLSGTGKTTLSSDPDRMLIGDDEHGWSDHGVFNFEGGCYAKTIRLSREAEPQIYATTRRFGTVLENVVVDPATRELNLDDDRYTENTRAAYPISFVENAVLSGLAGHPRNVVMLTADAFGVAPTGPGVVAEVWKPRNTWSSPAEYDVQAAKLARMFADNFKTFESGVTPEVIAAGPRA